ncbi:hypothetical protein SNOG_08631 [Parastagonospora nodorum SN15]|uniref:Uncharacterized protein n=1 Tax=Phaeosphaeria nodorum (strain SN15 / ATCC MYA-4574 / FGSC 10173) TaxID=321614 RepID=Q0UHY3_PHANO|nr:hypothetical protein SNOG_08631 [Parastagonospora nodorum SN15]EAT83799.1 hypothetical protein SNOG_08631 [Parastagonospora nodorum SN15]
MALGGPKPPSVLRGRRSPSSENAVNHHLDRVVQRRNLDMAVSFDRE